MMFDPQTTLASGSPPPPFSEDEYNRRTKKLHKDLASLKLAEAALYADSPQNVKQSKRKKESFFTFLIREVGRYVGYLVKTWSNCLKFFVLGGTISPVQLFPVFVFSFVGSWVLGLLLVYCIANRLPSKRLKKLIFGKQKDNSPTMFEAITYDQVNAAKRALSQPMRDRRAAQQSKIFNLDVAKLMCQLSSLMYQHDSGHTLEVMEKLRAKKTSKKQNKKCSIPKRQASMWEESLADTISPIEDSSEIIGQFLDKTQAAFIASEFSNNKGDSKISSFCKRFGIEYEPISELNSSSAAFSSVFWDRKSNWIIVAFKGTGPTDFAEWVTDLDYQLIEGGSWLKGFGRIHSGFAERIFPRSVKHLGGRRPYDTIAAAVSLIAEHLRENKMGKVNVWMTGHSLGTAIASLAYSRAVTGKHDFGKEALVRDAYLFATPILCDVTSVHAFNWAMFKDMEKPRTMWRITNRNDIVANGLPEQGDRPEVINPDNLFCFAHLGTEIKMPDSASKKCVVAGNHITQGIKVEIKSEFNDFELMRQRETSTSIPEDWMQNIPVIGNGFAHGIGNYWNALSKVNNGACQWVGD